MTTETPKGQLQSQRLLVADDDLDTRDLFRWVLESEGAEVMAVGSAAEVIQVLAAWTVDALISDICLPGEDGCSLLKRLRTEASGQGQELRAIAVTGWADAETRSRIMSAGFLEYLIKPVEIEELIRAVVRVTVPKDR